MAAVFYDTLLLLAVWFVATAALLPLNHGEAFRAGQYGYPVYLGAVSFIFYGWFWTHGGQTLGLRAWKIRLISDQGSAVSWRQVAIRFAMALLAWGCCGLGWLWRFWDSQGLMWHDRCSATRLVMVRE